MSTYTVVINGKPEGPYEFEELRELDIKPGTFVRTIGMDDYKEAHEFKELRELFGFRYEQTAPQYFASFDQRLIASIIDYFFLTLAYVVFILFIFIVVDDRSQRIMVGIYLLPLIPISKFIYSSFAEASVKQATIGKRLIDIKVTGLMGERIDLGTSISRNLAKAFSVLPIFFGYLYSFLNKKQQCWHDVIANTLVVKQRLI